MNSIPRPTPRPAAAAAMRMAGSARMRSRGRGASKVAADAASAASRAIAAAEVQRGERQQQLGVGGSTLRDKPSCESPGSDLATTLDMSILETEYEPWSAVQAELLGHDELPGSHEPVQHSSQGALGSGFFARQRSYPSQSLPRPTEATRHIEGRFDVANYFNKV